MLLDGMADAARVLAAMARVDDHQRLRLRPVPARKGG
jgi:hypothetical protein